MVNYEELWKELYKALEESVTDEWYGFNVTDLMDDLVERAQEKEMSSSGNQGVGVDE